MSCADSNFCLPLIFIQFAFSRLRGLRVSGSFVCAARSARAPNSKDRLLPRQQAFSPTDVSAKPSGLSLLVIFVN